MSARHLCHPLCIFCISFLGLCLELYDLNPRISLPRNDHNRKVIHPPGSVLIVSSHINDPVEHTRKAELCAAGTWIMHPYFTDGNTEAHNEKSLAGTQKAPVIQLHYSL